MSLIPEQSVRIDLRAMYSSFTILSAAAFAALLASQTERWAAAVGVGLLIFIASFATGAILGFLFGVPRVLSKGTETAVVTAAENVEAQERRRLTSNTNLERISDWLTTMLVGVGLSQLHNVNAALRGFSDYIARHAQVFTDAQGNLNAGVLPGVAPPILIFGAAAGFLLMYLYTRTSLVRLLDAVEMDLLTGGARWGVRRAADQIAKETGDARASELSTSRAVSIDDALELMFSALYRAGGYRQVIELGSQLMDTPAAERPEFWFYLAAAYGQQLHNRDSKEQKERSNDREQALEAAQRAVKLDSAYKQRLWDISNPAGYDNDLQDLRDDPEFRKIVGRKA